MEASEVNGFFRKDVDNDVLKNMEKHIHKINLDIAYCLSL